MDSDEIMLDAEDALAEVERVRSTARGVVMTLTWQTSVLWGVIFLSAVLVWLALSNSALSMLYWVVAVPAGIVTTWSFQSKLPRLRDSGSLEASFWVISGCMVIGSFGTWWVFDERPSTLIWYSVLLGGFAAFAFVDRQFWALGGISLLWLWGVAMWMSVGDSRADLDLAMAMFTTAIGAGLVGTGFGQRLGRPR